MSITVQKCTISVDALNNYGSALRELGRNQAALLSFERAIAVKPDDIAAHNNRAIVLIELGRLSEALQSCDKALALDADHAGALFTRANALYLAHASDIAYNRAPAEAALERLGLKTFAFRHNVVRTRGFLGVCDTHAVLAFRGTERTVRRTTPSRCRVIFHDALHVDLAPNPPPCRATHPNRR